MIYTTYFAKLNKLPENVVPISICGKAPDWYKGLQYKKLAPKYDFFMKWKETHDNDYCIQCFNEQVLNNLSSEKVLEELYDKVNLEYINSGISFSALPCVDIAFVCYEKPSDFCHRYLVADWLNNNGYECKEFEYK